MPKQNVLIINGKKYEATTGVLLDKPPKHKTSTKPPAKSKQHKAPTKPAAKPKRQPAKNLNAHKPAKASTLMRKGLAKPGASTKRKIKTSSHVDTLKKQSTAKIEIKKPAHKVDKQLLSYAQRIKKSPLIRHFNPITDVEYKFEPASPPSNVSSQPRPAKKAKRKPQTTEELLDYAISQANSHEQPLAPKPKRKLRLKIKRKV